jgi:hypothetical protein
MAHVLEHWIDQLARLFQITVGDENRRARGRQEDGDELPLALRLGCRGGLALQLGARSHAISAAAIR